MIYDIALTVALIAFGIGLIHRIDTWFIVHVGGGDRNIPMGERFAAGVKAVFGTIFSGKILSLAKVLVVDVLFQARILKDKQDPLAWVMHIFLFSASPSCCCFTPWAASSP